MVSTELPMIDQFIGEHPILSFILLTTLTTLSFLVTPLLFGIEPFANPYSGILLGLLTSIIILFIKFKSVL